MSSLMADEKEFLACCGSSKFAREMASLSPFPSLEAAVQSAKEIWFEKVDVAGWLEAFSAHPQIGQTPDSKRGDDTFAQWSKGEQSAAGATEFLSVIWMLDGRVEQGRTVCCGCHCHSFYFTGWCFSTMELFDWNAKYREKFGFIFLICASGKSTPEILAELKRRYSNKPITEFEIAAQEQMKITELRLAKLFAAKANPATSVLHSSTAIEKAGEDRISKIGVHLSPTSAPARPPITTHILDTARGCPAFGVEVRLERWQGSQPRPHFGSDGPSGWTHLGSSKTNKDGRSGQLMSPADTILPGHYRISFNTGEYNPTGFYPFVSVVFEIKESQKFEHFHVPLLLSPFSFSTYRGS